LREQLDHCDVLRQSCLQLRAEELYVGYGYRLISGANVVLVLCLDPTCHKEKGLVTIK